MPKNNYELANLLESRLARSEISKARLYKKRMVIGLLPERMILAFFDFFLKNMPFYDRNRKVTKVYIEDDETSLLN